MDLQKEREAFEKECKLLCYKGNMVMSNLGNFYNNEQTNWMWQMWLSSKNQAIPDGFVLVPRELSADEARKHAEAMFNKVERMARNEQRDLSESEFELFKNRWIDARTLTIQFDWKAIIEAQEPSQ